MPPAYYGVRTKDIPPGWDDVAWNVAWLGHHYTLPHRQTSQSGRSDQAAPEGYLKACVELCDLRLLKGGAPIRWVLDGMVKESAASYLLHVNLAAHPSIAQRLGPNWQAVVAERGLWHHIGNEALALLVSPETPAHPPFDAADVVMTKVMGKPTKMRHIFSPRKGMR